MPCSHCAAAHEQINPLVFAESYATAQKNAGHNTDCLELCSKWGKRNEAHTANEEDGLDEAQSMEKAIRERLTLVAFPEEKKHCGIDSNRCKHERVTE